MVAALAPTDLPTASWESSGVRREAVRTAFTMPQLLGQTDLAWHPHDSWKNLASRLSRLGQLGANWDSYGGKPIDATVIAFASSMLNSLAPWALIGVPAPTAVPARHGGIQLEWHSGPLDLEIEIVAPYDIRVLFADDATGQEEEFALRTDLSRLIPLLARFARPALAGR